MQIKTRLLLSFLFLTLLILFQFLINYHASGEQQILVQRMILEHDISNRLSGLALAAQKIRRFEKEYFIYVGNEHKRSNYYQEFQGAGAEIREHLKRLREQFATPDRQQQLAELSSWEKATTFYLEGFEQVHRQVISGQITGVIEANSAIKDAKNRFREVLHGAEAAIARQLSQARIEADQIALYNERSSLLFTIVTDISLLLGLFISYQVPKSICKPVKELTELSDGISKGRINKPVQVTGSGEIEELSKSIERLRIAVRGLLLRVNESKRKKARSA